ncbi:MAG: phospholipase D family protein [Frankiaceae bacterium]
MRHFSEWVDRLDRQAGAGLETVVRRHHRRRLRGLGWRDALESVPGAELWAPRAPVRTGNSIDVLVDGASAFGALEKAIREATRHVHIAGWHASPDFRLTRPNGSPLRDLLAETAERIPVRLLLWAGPPLPLFPPSRHMVKAAQQEFSRDSQVHCVLDGRERTLHCHHEKIAILDGEVAFVGGIDLTALQGDRYDDPAHAPHEPMGWHDVAVRLQGPAVADVAQHFIQRWGEVTGEHLPEPATCPTSGNSDVQVLRTVPEHTYQFSPTGAFTILDAYLRGLRSARNFIYLENQFLWSPEVVDVLVDKLEQPPADGFRILLLLPAKPSNGADSTRGQLGRLLEADADAGRLLATTISGIGDGRSAPVYVHAKVGIIDDRWLTIGSANLNEHSLFNDTEMNVLTDDPELARRTRLRLWSEHTEQPPEALDGDAGRVIDTVWRPLAEEQARRDGQGMHRTHRLTLLPDVSRRTARLRGPMSGLLVDG